MFVKDYGSQTVHIQREGKVNLCGRKRKYEYPGEEGLSMQWVSRASVVAAMATGWRPYAQVYQILPDGARLCKTCQKKSA